MLYKDLIFLKHLSLMGYIKETKQLKNLVKLKTCNR
jgi:hypothetical protein